MIRRETRKFMMAAGTALFILPFFMPVCAFAEDSASSDYQQRMREELENSDDFDETLAKQHEGVMQDLEALKAKTKIDRTPLVNQEDRPYFEVTPEEPPVVEEPAPQQSYTYKKKSNNVVPSRSFNNVR